VWKVCNNSPVVQIPPPGGWQSLETEEQAVIRSSPRRPQWYRHVSRAPLLAAVLANIKHEFEFLNDPDGVPWARVLVGGQNGHYEHIEVRSKGSAFQLFVALIELFLSHLRRRLDFSRQVLQVDHGLLAHTDESRAWPVEIDD
jgi:hypothetical protein